MGTSGPLKIKSQQLHIEELPNFDVFTGGLKKSDASGESKEQARKNLQAVTKRLSAYVKQNRCEYATGWYKMILSRASNRLGELKEREETGSANHTRGQKKSIEAGAQHTKVPSNQGTVRHTDVEEGWTVVGNSRAMERKAECQRKPATTKATTPANTVTMKNTSEPPNTQTVEPRGESAETATAEK